MTHIIAVTNQKGGVGKTTITYNLAHEFAARGEHVLVIDNDPQGNLTSCFLEQKAQLPPSANVLNAYKGKLLTPLIRKKVSLLGADIALSTIREHVKDVEAAFNKTLKAIASEYSLIFIDCPPTFGHLPLAALTAATHVLVPVTAAPFPIDGLQSQLENIKKAQNDENKRLKILGILLNLVDGKKTKIGFSFSNTLRNAYKDLVFQTSINRAVKLEESPMWQEPINEFDPTSKVAHQIKTLADEIMERLS
jgi:chromosome partitioning protein